MMDVAKRTIRIVKRKHSDLPADEEPLLCLKTATQAKRDMIQTVTSWITERREGLSLEQGRGDALRVRGLS